MAVASGYRMSERAAATDQSEHKAYCIRADATDQSVERVVVVRAVALANLIDKDEVGNK